MKPRGGTELQFEFLSKHVDSDLLNQFQICTSIPGKVPIDPNKINVLWQKNSYDQQNLAPWFSNRHNHTLYDWYVFNSHWNYEKFRYMFGIPSERSVVIKNGITSFPKRQRYKKGDPIKLIFQPTPWRGLNVLLLAMSFVKNKNISLDVYSSCEVYGEDFKKQNDHLYYSLYEQARQLENVNYIGYKPNEYILENISNYQMFVYPCVWEETFCISAAESLSAGLCTITTNFGALFETCSEWPRYINYQTNLHNLAKEFAEAIEETAETLHTDEVQDKLDEQQKFYERFYNWKLKGEEWTKFFKRAINEKV